MRPPRRTMGRLHPYTNVLGVIASPLPPKSTTQKKESRCGGCSEVWCKTPYLKCPSYYAGPFAPCSVELRPFASPLLCCGSYAPTASTKSHIIHPKQVSTCCQRGVCGVSVHTHIFSPSRDAPHKPYQARLHPGPGFLPSGVSNEGAAPSFRSTRGHNPHLSLF